MSETLAPQLPPSRGPLSAFLFEKLRGEPQFRLWRHEPPVAGATDDDLHLALYCCYELHYRGFAGIDDRWEWDSGLLAFRERLEQAVLADLIDEVGPPAAVADIATELHAIVNGGDGPSLSGYMAERGTPAEFREFAIHRSAYQLKEADPHTWVIPRLAGTAKAALLEIQTDEYGSGQLEAMHSTLFARTMRCLGLDPTYGAYLAALPGVTLATVNLISFFGLHRRWRGALLGHLAVFEMASVGPNGRYSRALRRQGFGPEATAFYDVHVRADAVHEVIAVEQLARGFAADEPHRAGDVVFGARAIMAVEGRFTRHLLDAWAAGTTSLYRPGLLLTAAS